MIVRKGQRLGSVLVDKASTGPAGELTETEQEADRNAAQAREELAKAVSTEAQRPPTSGPGSGVDAWRRYAAEVTDSPSESWATLSRDEIIELLGQPAEKED